MAKDKKNVRGNDSKQERWKNSEIGMTKWKLTEVVICAEDETRHGSENSSANQLIPESLKFWLF